MKEDCEGIARDVDDGSLASRLDGAYPENEYLEMTFFMSGAGEYRGAEILMTFGGPTIWIDTRKRTVEGRWGSKEVSVPVSPKMVEKLDDYCEQQFRNAIYQATERGGS